MSFASDIRKYADKQKRNLNEVATESLVNLSASVIIKTPVKEGILANNWQATTDAPASSVILNANNSGQMQDVEQAIGASLGGIYYLVNNLPYARPIEFLGYSQKAPNGMLRISIENYQKFIDNAISQLN